jgi:hypothetical protein
MQLEMPRSHDSTGLSGKELVTFTVRYVTVLLFGFRAGHSNFTYRWECVSNKLYKYSLTYEASGVGDTLSDDLRLRLDGDRHNVSDIVCSSFNR